MTKYYDIEVSRRWVVSAPDDMDEDEVYDKVINDFVNIDFREIADISEMDEIDTKFYAENGVDVEL